jgi:dTDP-L-rhamnose 4-epimerase
MGGRSEGTVLVTGGAGFIGSHLAERLLARGLRVRALDALVPQVHGEGGGRPDDLDGRADLVVGDVRDPRAVAEAVEDADAVVHLAARVGVGQSMYRMAEYVSGNDLGTAVLLEALRERHARRPLRRLVVASSMSVYGEGLYLDADGAPVERAVRDPARLAAGLWDPADASGRPLSPAPTPEGKRPDLVSVYALGKFAQERLCLVAGAAYGIPTVALRFFNVYGPGQALSNPYTGVMANFAVRLMNGRRPMVFEDGEQRRDFVHVRDAARAIALALDAPDAPGLAVNVGSGRSAAIREVAGVLADALGRADLAPEITGRARTGDVRHCFADVGLAADVLGFRAEVGLEDGVAGLVRWLGGRTAEDRVDQARDELLLHGLAR